jgi:hypothetical protein
MVPGKLRWKLADYAKVGMLDTPIAAQYKAKEKRLPRKLRLGEAARENLAGLSAGRATRFTFQIAA